MSVTHAEFTLERHYRVTPAQAFAAWADPALKRRWFAGPWDDVHHALDFRVGGTEVHTGGHPGGRRNAFHSRFHDIVEPERIVYAYDLLHDDALVSVSLVTVVFAAAGGGTRMRFTEQGAFLDDPGAPAEREHGTGLILDRLGPILGGPA